MHGRNRLLRCMCRNKRVHIKKRIPFTSYICGNMSLTVLSQKCQSAHTNILTSAGIDHRENVFKNDYF